MFLCLSCLMQHEKILLHLLCDVSSSLFEPKCPLPRHWISSSCESWSVCDLWPSTSMLDGRKADREFLLQELKSQRGTFNCLWSSLNLIVMRRIHTYICKWDHRWVSFVLLSCFLPCLHLFHSVSRGAMKYLTAHRPEETIRCFQAWPIHRSLFCYL